MRVIEGDVIGVGVGEDVRNGVGATVEVDTRVKDAGLNGELVFGVRYWRHRHDPMTNEYVSTRGGTWGLQGALRSDA